MLYRSFLRLLFDSDFIGLGMRIVVQCFGTFYGKGIRGRYRGLSLIRIVVRCRRIGRIVVYRRLSLLLLPGARIGRVHGIVARHILPRIEIHRDVLSVAGECTVNIRRVVELGLARCHGLLIEQKPAHPLCYDGDYDLHRHDLTLWNIHGITVKIIRTQIKIVLRKFNVIRGL